MVQVRWHGRLGNQLFQYAIGRIIAEMLGYQLNSPPLSGFPATKDRVSGTVVPNYRHLNGQSLDLEEIRKLKGNRGFFSVTSITSL